jgi:L-ascorbate metabolism protein UlaG (beta-lactamase superfamily)
MKVTGKLPSGKHLAHLRRSANFKSKGFENLSATPMMQEGVSYWKMVKEFFKKNKEARPSALLPSVKSDLHSLKGAEPVIIWFGHSSYFIRIAGKNILVDPVFSGYAAPLSFMVKAFRGSDIYKADDIPPIDGLILTHDHYDHLDYKTLRKLKSKVKNVYCSLGVGAHLSYWGFEQSKIREMDWWDMETLDKHLSLTAAPARHFSGRGIKRFQTLWSSFILRAKDHNLFLGGDSGYDSHFKLIGERYGPFDIAILESGQYNTMWPLIHMFPEETVQASIDLKARVLMPVHWGKFSLAMHSWNEPIIRIMKKAKELNVRVTTPRIGEPVVIGQSNPESSWWETVR